MLEPGYFGCLVNVAIRSRGLAAPMRLAPRLRTAMKKAIIGTCSSEYRGRATWCLDMQSYCSNHLSAGYRER